jgi:superfamily I DNA/RNA helicase
MKTRRNPAGRHRAARAHRRQLRLAERFLTELTLDPPDASSDEAGPPLLDEDYLILSTIHSAKGQEWTAVHVLNAVDGCIPSDMATGSAPPKSRRNGACCMSP